VPVQLPVCWPVPAASHLVISARLPTPYMYFNSFANYFGINRAQTGTKFMLVCAGGIANAGAGGHSIVEFLPIRPRHRCISIPLPIIMP